ncbi:MAG: protein-L-isoaspartate(D-aspartate) O-methyltransferase [Anaerolineae bacterium]|nr:protein-L-isoaspartate(D-aspartate) O-methyltransferase [Anaerolineae bacterium]
MDDFDTRTEDRQAAMVALIRSRGVRDPLVLAAMEQVPRHKFVAPEQRSQAYGDYPLSIGHCQTISQPYIVALMTQMLSLKPGNRVLEIGTGSGYQAAILAEMGMEVYTVERIAMLHEETQARLQELGYTNVHCRFGNGYAGWPEHSPYQGIIVTAAPTQIPPPLMEQLDEGGHLVIPVGPLHGYQTLWLVIRHGDQFEKIDLGGVAFVPFVHK